MSKIDEKYFGFVPYQNSGYNYQDKATNVNNYVKYMLNRSLAMFKYHNLPDTIPQEELEKMLQCAGGCVWYKHENDLYVFNATLGGEGDVYNRPTKAVISNPALKLTTECVIDEDCVFMQNDSMCMGLVPMYQKYCTILNETDITMILATINKRVQILLSANDDNTVASAKKFIENIENGKLGVIAESKLFDSLKTSTVATSNTNSLQDIYQLQQYVKASMYNEIGLGANWNSKKERLAVAEVETNSDNLYPLVDDMLNNRRKALEKINEMFGTDIQVEFNSSWDYRLYNGENIDTLEEDNIHDEEVETTCEDVAGNEEPSVEPTDEPTLEPTETNNETSEESAGDENVNDETSEDGGTDEQPDDAEEVSEQSEEEPNEEQSDDEQSGEEQEKPDEPVNEETPDAEQEEESEEKEDEK
jgi:hypothetical protein